MQIDKRDNSEVGQAVYRGSQQSTAEQRKLKHAAEQGLGYKSDLFTASDEVLAGGVTGLYCIERQLLDFRSVLERSFVDSRALRGSLQTARLQKCCRTDTATNE